MNVKRTMDIELTQEQSEIVKAMWAKYAEPQAATMGQVRWQGVEIIPGCGCLTMRLTIIKPDHARQICELLKTFKNKESTNEN